MKKILISGFGNPGRQDDGLGNEFVNEVDNFIKEKKLQNISTDSNYQLNIEDSLAMSEFDIVVFADASEEAIENFIFTEVDASKSRIEFSMHAVSPSYVLDLCQKLYKKSPEAYLIHIKGKEWDFKEGISEQARINLNLAVEFIKDLLYYPEKMKDSVDNSLNFRDN